MIQRLTSLAALILLFGVSSGLWAQTISVGGTVVDGDMPCRGVCDGERLVRRHRHRPRRKICPTAESGATLVFSHRIPPSRGDCGEHRFGFEGGIEAGCGRPRGGCRHRIRQPAAEQDLGCGDHRRHQGGDLHPRASHRTSPSGPGRRCPGDPKLRSARVDPDHPNSGFGLHQQLRPLVHRGRHPFRRHRLLEPVGHRASAS